MLIGKTLATIILVKLLCTIQVEGMFSLTTLKNMAGNSKQSTPAYNDKSHKYKTYHAQKYIKMKIIYPDLKLKFSLKNV